MDSGVFDDDGTDQPNGVFVSVYGRDASDQARNHLTGRVGDYDCDALPPAPRVAENLRDYGMRGAVLQRLRSGGAVVRKGAAVESYRPDAERATVRDCANRRIGAFCCPDHICCEEIPR